MRLRAITENTVAREKFKDYYQKAIEEIVALGITPQQMAILKKYGLLATDNVTGYQEGRSGSARYQTVVLAIEHVAKTGVEAYYVEMDLQNLGGINAVLGHTGANELYATIAHIVQHYLQQVASDSAFFRHGGDEISAVLLDTTAEAIAAAFEKIRHAVALTARKFGVHQAPHPKHPGDRALAGTGVHYGLALITPEHAQQPEAIFREADTRLEQSKRERAA